MRRRLAALLGFIFIAPLLGLGSPSAQSAAPSTPQRAQRPPGGLLKFTITLLVGDTQPGPSEGLSPAATKALADLKDFLPYKQFRVLDSLPIIGVTTPWLKVRGLNTQQFNFQMSGMEITATTVAIQLQLVEPGKEATIGAQFKMEIGETVVVGTSRLEGTKALILLVTSVP